MDYRKIEANLREDLLIDVNEIDEEILYDISCSVVEEIIYNTIEQCRNYFVDDEFFGPLPPSKNDDFSKIRLVMQIDEVFTELSKKIILENVVMNLFLSLGKEVYKSDKIADGTVYLGGFYGYGYYEISDNINQGFLDKKYVESCIGTNHVDEEYFKSTRGNWFKYIDEFKKSSYILSYRTKIPTLNQYFDELEKRKGKEPYSIPLFDCFLMSILIKNTVFLNKISGYLQEKDEKKKIELLNSIRHHINKLQVEKDYLRPREQNQRQNREYESDEIREKRVLDQNVIDYQLECFFHCRFQNAIAGVETHLKKQYGLDVSYLKDTLINSVSMNLQFGAEYILWHPLKYIHSPYISFDTCNNRLNSSSHYANSFEAERIWVNKYCDYLDILSYVTIPIVRTVFELNLYKYSKSTIVSDDVKDIKRKMFELLEEYEFKHSDAVNYDYIKDAEIIREKNDKTLKFAKSYIQQYKFSKRESKCLEKIGITSLSAGTLTKSLQAWYDPENYDKYHLRMVDKSYYDTSNDMVMEYYDRAIAEAKENLRKKELAKRVAELRKEAIVVKYRRKLRDNIKS